MSNYCACSGGDEEYTIELNQQGPEGHQGEVGPEGFSPSISVKTSTDKAYILTVVNKEGNFDTPNLYGELEKLNADLSNIPNPAYINGISLASIEDNIPMITMDSSRITTNVDGNLILNATASNEETMEVFNYEVVANPKDQRLELHDNEGNIKIVATTDEIPTINVATTTTAGIVKPDGSTITVSPDGTISAVQQDLSNLATKEELASTNATVTNLQTTVASNTTSIGTLREDLSNLETTVGNNSADIAALDANKLEQSNIIAGANITINRNGNNLTINSTGGGGSGSGDVTAAGDNRFTGDNTFTGKVNIAGGALTVEGLATLNQVTAQYLNAVSITSSGEVNATSIKANGLRSDDIQTTENKKYLTEVDVDNQTIQIVNGKLHANLDELGNEVNDLSNRVTTLQTSKQDTLTAGANITIVDNVISATGGGSGGSSIDDGSISSATTWSSSKINSEITTVANTKNDNIFDISKFTVVGNPVISADGVASEFRSGNYIKTVNSSLLANPFELYFGFTATNVTNRQTIFGMQTGYGFNIALQSGKMMFGASSNGIELDIANNLTSSLTINENIKYLGCLKWTGTVYTLSLYINNAWVDYITVNNSNAILGDKTVNVGVINNIYSYVNGSIDLKAFKVYVDGEQVFNGLMNSTKPIYDKITNTNTALSTFETETDNNFSAVNSALNEKANLSDLAGYVTVNKYNELLARVVALETEINGGNA